MKEKILLGTVLLLLTTASYSSGWDTSFDKDEMTGKKSAYASSNFVSPTKTMDFPYNKTKAWLGIGCDGTSEWVYVGFNTAPNLTNTDTKSGYSEISTRIKFNDKVEYTTLTQDWGAKFIHFRDNKYIVSNIDKSNSLLLELQWHGNGKTYFNFPLNGSSSAISKIRKFCNTNNKINKNSLTDKELKKQNCLSKGLTWRFGKNGNIECGN